jgi:hypothetical protein
VKEQADKWNAPIVEPPRGRRDEFVDPYFRGAGPDQVIVILKAREPARIMTAIGDKKLNRWRGGDRFPAMLECISSVRSTRASSAASRHPKPAAAPTCSRCSTGFLQIASHGSFAGSATSA